MTRITTYMCDRCHRQQEADKRNLLGTPRGWFEFDLGKHLCTGCKTEMKLWMSSK